MQTALRLRSPLTWGFCYLQNCGPARFEVLFPCPLPTGRPAWAGVGQRQAGGAAPRAPGLRLVGSLPCPQTSPVGSLLAGREMGLGEGVGWQKEGNGWQREGAEGPQLVTLFFYQDGSYSHRPSWWGGG